MFVKLDEHSFKISNTGAYINNTSNIQTYFKIPSPKLHNSDIESLSPSLIKKKTELFPSSLFLRFFFSRLFLPVAVVFFLVDDIDAVGVKVLGEGLLASFILISHYLIDDGIH